MLAAEGERIFAPVSFYEIDSKVYQHKLKDKFQDSSFTDEGLKALFDDPVQLTSKQLSRLKLSLLFCDWLTPVPLIDLENEYNLRSGFISQAAGELAWLLDSASAVAKVLDSNDKLVKFLKDLASQVQFGVGKDMIEIAKLKVSGLGRDYLWKLSLKEITSKKQVEEIDLDELKKTIPEKVASRLKDVIKTGRDAWQCVSTNSWEKESRRDELVLDGSLLKGKYAVIIDGRRILLSYKSFKYLFKLAWAVFKKEGGWIHKLDLEEGENQGKYIYRLKKELSDSGKLLIENNRVGCYRLNLKKEQIQLSVKTLENFQDFEIRQLLDELILLNPIPLK